MSLNGGPPSEQVSYLVVDCGTETTSAALFDLVEGVYYLLAAAEAPTTAGAPHDDLLVGVRAAIGRLTTITGRRLLSESGELITPQSAGGAGVDRFVVTCSAAEPLTVVVVALLEAVSLASARRVLRAGYTRQLETISLADGRSDLERVRLLVEQRPELVFVTGGTEGGAEQPLLHMIEIVRAAISEQPAHLRADVLYAGNSRLWEPVLARLEDVATVVVAENVRPTMEEEQLGDAVRLLGDQYRARKIAALPGMERLAAWSTYPPIATARAFADMIGYLAALHDKPVVGIDLGAGSVCLVVADGKQVRLAVNSDLGMGRALRRLDVEEHAAGIMSWALEEIGSKALEAYLAGEQPRLRTPALRERDRMLESAAIRHILRLALASAKDDAAWAGPGESLPAAELLVLRGRALTRRSRDVQTMLAILDAMEPVGIVQVVADRYDVLSALGAVAPLQPLAPVQALAGGALLELGWIVAPGGNLPEGEEALEIAVSSQSLGNLKIEIESGAIELLPLPPGTQAELRLFPQAAVDVGAGPGNERVITINGGQVGLIVDARGRPLPDVSALPASERRALLHGWQKQVGA